jgi:ribonucleoside-diphosphate reductase alpha chain
VMDAFSIAVSIGLQYGVPLETFVSKFTNLSFEPNGLTDDPDVRMSKSLMDYVFRRLALDYLSFDERQALGIYSAEERQRYLETGSYEPIEDDEVGNASEVIGDLSAPDGDSPVVEEVALRPSRDQGDEDTPLVEEGALRPSRDQGTQQAHTSAELLEQITGTAVDSPLCMTCGTKMRPAGSCYVCEGCGSTSGCS